MKAAAFTQDQLCLISQVWPSPSVSLQRRIAGYFREISALLLSGKCRRDLLNHVLSVEKKDWCSPVKPYINYMPFLMGLINTVLRTKQTDSCSASNIWEELLALWPFLLLSLKCRNITHISFPLETGKRNTEYKKLIFMNDSMIVQ